MRQRSRKKIILLIMSILIISAITYYGIMRYEYEYAFCKNTIINGIDCSTMSIEEAKEAIQHKEDKYVLEIIFKDNEIEKIPGPEIKFTVKDLDKELKNIKDNQRKGFFLKGGKYNFSNFSYDRNKLKEILSSKKQLQKDYMKEKTKIKYYFNLMCNRFEIQEPDTYYLDLNQVLKKVSKAIVKGESIVSMKNLYFFNIKDSNLDELNSIISAKITYQLPHGKVYELSANTLHTWLAQDENGNIFKDEAIWNKNIEEFVTKKLSDLADTTGRKRKFKPTGKSYKISVKGGNYGYQIDTTAEIERLKEELLNQEQVVREPCYTKKEVSTKKHSLGKSYVEIDLTRQKVWVYVDGQLKVETDCVTGCVNKGHETPTGVYTLAYKEKDTILKGDKLPNGKYSYQSHVDYWMPFNRGIGLHDASWRKNFGSKIYINSGSHGCVNLPLEAAKEIYDIINSNMPIVVYKS